MRSPAFFITASFACLIACSRETSLPEVKTETPSPARQVFASSPQEAVTSFYRYVNDGHYSKAKELYTSDARKAIDGEFAGMTGGFVNWADSESRDGSIEKVILGRVTRRGEGGRVEFTVLYRDGTSHYRKAPVLKEGASWKVGLVEKESSSPADTPELPLTREEAQKRTMADMRMVAMAWEARATDTNTYAIGPPSGTPTILMPEQVSAVLSPTYIKKMPMKDGWGTPFVFEVGDWGQTYVIRSLGMNAISDPEIAGATNDPNADIIFSNGRFVSYPSGAF